MGRRLYSNLQLMTDDDALRTFVYQNEYDLWDKIVRNQDIACR